MEISDSYLSLMNAVLAKRVRSAADNNEITAHGIDGEAWPDCEAKRIMLHFNNLLKFGFEGAKLGAWGEYGDYLKMINFTGVKIPTKQELVEKLAQENKLFWANIIMNKLSDNPNDLDKVIRDYQAQRYTGVRKLNLKDQIEALVRENERRVAAGDSKVVIPNFEKLSDMVQGFNPQCLTLLSAMTGVGKTNLCVSLAQSANMVMDVLFINMEMGEYDFGSRFLHNACKIDNHKWRDGSYRDPEKQLQAYADAMATRHNLWYTDGKALTINQIEHEIYNVFNGKNKGIVFVDYDQKIIMDSKADEWKALLDAMVRLEEVAKRCNVHIVVAAQANEEGRAKASKRMEQPMTNVLNFSRVANGIDRNLDRYFIKAHKTRNSALGEIEMGADLATSRVWEIDYVKPIINNGGASANSSSWLK